MASESIPVTMRHRALVRELLAACALELTNRGAVHDESKFDPIEQGPLDELQRLVESDGPAAYGTAEYERRKALLGPMIAHHNANNPHHPEAHPDGMAGFDLFDLVECFMDWRAANIERDAGAPMNLSYSVQKYGIQPMLESILRNTAARQGWAVK